MANNHYENIFKHFKNTFESHFNYAEDLFSADSSSNKKIHNLEFGAYREKLVRGFLRAMVPNKLEISQGFLISRNERTSKQTDIVIYDRNNSPLIEDQLNNRFFPVESVVGIGEVKSIIYSKEDLKKILKTLAGNKYINRDKNTDYIVYRENNDPERNYKMLKDKPFSFLICKKFNFDTSNIENEIENFYGDIDIRLWHNFIFSIEDGFIGFQNPDTKNIAWTPTGSNFRNKCLIRTPGKSGLAHFRSLAKAINILSFSTSIYRPHLPDYITFDPTAELRYETNK